MSEEAEFKIKMYARIGRWSFWASDFFSICGLIGFCLIGFSQFWRVAVQDGSRYACFLNW